jgi:hypothetical protein
MELLLEFSKNFKEFELQIRALSAVAGSLLFIVSLFTFISRKNNAHKEDISIVSLFARLMFCIFLMDLDVVLSASTESIFAVNEAAEVGNYLSALDSANPETAIRASLLAGCTVLGRIFGFLAGIAGWQAGGETNDLERRKHYRNAFFRWIAAVIFVSADPVTQLIFPVDGDVDFSVTGLIEVGFKGSQIT